MTAGRPSRRTDRHEMDSAFRAFRAFLERATADPTVIGLVLMGSRGYGAEIVDESDYDIMVVVDGDPAAWQTERGSSIEAWAMSLERFRQQGLPGSRDAWNRPAFLGVKVLLDRTDGEIGRLVEARRTLRHDEAVQLASTSLDGYINSLYRSLRNLEAGRMLEGRLDALESIGSLLTAVFAFEDRVRPFNKWLRYELQVRPIGFGDLTDVVDRLSADTAAASQRAAFRRVEVAARAAGHGPVIDGWEPDVQWIRGNRSAATRQGGRGVAARRDPTPHEDMSQPAPSGPAGAQGTALPPARGGARITRRAGPRAP